MNEQNEQAVGFEVKGRSELDSLGKPFPLLHMHLRNLAQEGNSDEEAI